jgi:hypothetical protein
MRRFEITVMMALSVVFVLAGCGAKQMALPVPPEDSLAVLVVYRDFHINASGYSAPVYFDGYSVGTLYNKNAMEIRTVPGVHTLMVDDKWSMREDILEVDLESSEVKYYEVCPTTTRLLVGLVAYVGMPFCKTFFLKQIPKEEAVKHEGEFVRVAIGYDGKTSCEEIFPCKDPPKVKRSPVSRKRSTGLPYR